MGALLILATAAFALEIGDKYEDKGTLLDLPDGTQLQLFVEDNIVTAYFIDEEGFIMGPPAESILIVNNDPLSKSQKWRTVLSPSGAMMTGARKLYPPYSFRGMVIVRMPDADPIAFHKVALELGGN
jgi:hypothetical protein